MSHPVILIFPLIIVQILCTKIKWVCYLNPLIFVHTVTTYLIFKWYFSFLCILNESGSTSYQTFVFYAILVQKLTNFEPFDDFYSEEHWLWPIVLLLSNTELFGNILKGLKRGLKCIKFQKKVKNDRYGTQNCSKMLRN